MSEEIVDIAFCYWNELPSASDFEFLALGAELAATKDVMEAEQIGVGNEVAFAGLFVNHHGEKRNEPIVRFGNICGIPAEPVSTNVAEIEAYLVELRSVGGLSGSPVIVDVGPHWIVDNVRQPRQASGKVLYLLGVVNGHFEVFVQTATVDVSPSDEHVNKGVAVITPIDKVLNVIQQSRFGELMKASEKAVIRKLAEIDLVAVKEKIDQGHSVEISFEYSPEDYDEETETDEPGTIAPPSQ
jgi:hypothetical protein